MVDEPVPLFVDDRAGSKDLMQYLPGAILTRLESADIMTVGNGPEDATWTIGIEVKSINDLMQSINTGRFAATQLPSLIEYDVPYLLYFGDYRAGSDGTLQILNGSRWRSFRLGSRSVPYGYLESFLFDVEAVGVRVRHAHSAAAGCDWVRALHRWWSKPWEQHRGLRQFDRSRELSLLPGMDHRTSIVARFASQLPGIGYEKACAVAGYFGTVKEMVNAHPSRWAQIPGIGKGLSTSIVDLLEG